MSQLALTVGTLVAFVTLTACATRPTLGGGGTVATGGAGGATSTNASPQLRHCDKTLGTMGVEEDQTAPWYAHLGQYNLGSTVPVLRTLIQQ